MLPNVTQTRLRKNRFDIVNAATQHPMLRLSNNARQLALYNSITTHGSCLSNYLAITYCRFDVRMRTYIVQFFVVEFWKQSSLDLVWFHCHPVQHWKSVFWLHMLLDWQSYSTVTTHNTYQCRNEYDNEMPWKQTPPPSTVKTVNCYKLTSYEWK